MKEINYCTQCRRGISSKDNYCEYCGTKNDHWNPKEGDFCKNCHRPLKEDEQQCPICGQKQDEPVYRSPYSVVYGPPPATRYYKCPNPVCGLEWSETQMFDHTEFCPKCGSRL